MSCSPKIRAYLIVQGFNINESPSGREVISLKKVDSLVALVNAREAKKVSVTQCWRDLDKIHLNPIPN
jgi:hypothetical protein